MTKNYDSINITLTFLAGVTAVTVVTLVIVTTEAYSNHYAPQSTPSQICKCMSPIPTILTFVEWNNLFVIVYVAKYCQILQKMLSKKELATKKFLGPFFKRRKILTSLCSFPDSTHLVTYSTTNSIMTYLEYTNKIHVKCFPWFLFSRAHAY